MDDSQSLGRFIRQSRLDRGMSLGQLAGEIGRSSSSVRRWERDEVAPALTVMPVLADVLKVDVGELERRRPSLVDEADELNVIDIVATTGSSTIEQQPVPAQPIGSEETSPESRLGLFGDLWSAVTEGKDSWIGWVRGIATAVVVIILLIVFVWAVGELFSALKEVWNSLGTGS
jgi:transcriptional regulator with XRE-family HTH domain